MPQPAAAAVEKCIRSTTRRATAADEEVTVNVIRERVEAELGLQPGSLKSAEWKNKSRDIVKTAMEDAPSQPSPSPSPRPSAASKQKRKRVEAQPPKKRRKNTPPSDSEQDEGPGASNGALAGPPAAPDHDDQSDYSSVIDEPLPAKKKRQPKSTSPPADKPAKATKTAKSTTAQEPSPDEQEIKRLQGQLVQCGVRKLWHRELAKCSTSREKIKHLKQMLADVGLTGRFSAEKARQIKEARELEAEIAAAKEFEKQWGQGDADEDDSASEGGRQVEPPKRLPKGLVDFGDSGDEGSD